MNDDLEDRILDVIRVAVAEEREACAKLAESHYHKMCAEEYAAGKVIAADIRARGNP